MTPRGVALVMVGDELLDGRVRETNSAWLVDELRRMRAELRGISVVGDAHEDIAGALATALGRARAVVVSGGLGPTPDDRTREALAAVAGEELVLDPVLLEVIEERFRKRGRSMTESNRQQAMRTPSGESLPNPVGTAPGLWQELQDSLCVLLPGVPAEMRAIWVASVRDRLSARVGGRTAATVRLRLSGIAESALADRVRALIRPDDGVDITYCVGRNGVDLLLRAQPGGDPRIPLPRLTEALSPHVYAVGETELEERILTALAERGESLAVAESCTGGMLGAALTGVPGASDVFVGGVIAYSDAVKRDLLGVGRSALEREGAVSEGVARAMAEGARLRLQSTWALSTTGIAGPGGGSEQKPVGTVWIGLAGPGGTQARRLRFAGGRGQNQTWSVAAALDFLRRALDLPRPDGEGGRS